MTTALRSPTDTVRSAERATPVVVLFGCPGAGKGTLAGFLAGRHGFAHLSTGAAMRAWAAGPRLEQASLRAAMARGEYGSDALAVRIVEETIAALAPETPAVILDGFPRTLAQYEAWRARGGSGSAVLLTLDERVAIERIAGRGTCPVDGLPAPHAGDPCPSCGRPTERRSDDGAIATVQRRFEAYRQTVLPILAAWRRDGLSLRTFAADCPLTALEAFAADIARSTSEAAVRP